MAFDFYIGGYFHDHSYRLVLKDDTLNISDYIGKPIPEHAKTVSVQGNEDWQRLIEFLKGCDWKKRYYSNTLDGTQWELKAKGDGTNIKSCGSNAYPDNFDRFLGLVNSVTKAAGVSISK